MPENHATGSEQELKDPLPAQLERRLEGAVFPLDRERLTWVARENDAPTEVLTALAGLPVGPFRSVAHILENLQARSEQSAET